MPRSKDQPQPAPELDQTDPAYLESIVGDDAKLLEYVTGLTQPDPETTLPAVDTGRVVPKKRPFGDERDRQGQPQ